MVQVKVKSYYVPTLPELLRLVLKFIYEPLTMSLQEEEMMQRAFVCWANKVNKHEFEEYALGKMAQMLERNQRGGYNRRKAMFAEHGIDYRKFHRLAEHSGITRKRWGELIELAKADVNRVREIEAN